MNLTFKKKFFYRYLGEEEDLKSDEDTNKKMCKLLSKIKKRSKLKSLIEPDETFVENDKTSVVLKCKDSLEIVKSEPKEKKRKKKKSLTDVGLSNEVRPVENESGIISQSLEDEMERLNVDESNETNSRLENDDEDENGNAETSLGEVFPVIGDYKFKKKNKVGWLIKII